VRKRRKKQIKANARERAEEGEGGASNKWRIEFLHKLAETSNVSQSATFAGVCSSRVYRTRRGDAEFAAQWRAALIEGYENLELEVLCYLRAGDPGRKMDVAGALKLLALHAQTIARARALADNRDEQEVFDSIDAMIDEMRERAAANEAEVAGHAAEDDDGDA
jgi:hypothetical protein